MNNHKFMHLLGKRLDIVGEFIISWNPICRVYFIAVHHSNFTDEFEVSEQIMSAIWEEYKKTLTSVEQELL